MNIQIIDKSYLCEIPVAAGSTATQFLFPVLQNLDGKYTQGLSSYGVGAMPKSPMGSVVVNAALFAASFVNLFVGDVNQYWNMPLMDFVTIRSSLATAVEYTNPFAIEFDNVRIIWAKSYVFVSDVTLIAGGQVESYVFNIKYTDGVTPKEK